MSLNPSTYAEAVERANSRPVRPRKPLKAGKPLSRGQKPLSTKPKLKKKAKKRKVTKKHVWKEFSIFIRTRDADPDGMQSCYTCDIRKHWKQLEAGHFVPGRYNSILFEERAVRPQCRQCNGHLRGNIIVYYPKMVAMYGQVVVDEIIAAKVRTHKWLPGELEGLLEKYRVINRENPLLKEKGTI